MGSGAPRASPAEGSSDEVHVEAVVARSRLHHRRRGGGGRQSGAGWLGRRRARRHRPRRPSELADSGPISGLLPRDHLTEESAIQVDLSKETVRLPLYKGTRQRPDGLVRAARRLRRRARPRPGRQLRAQARQHRDRLPRLRADGDARLAHARPEPVRAGGRQLPGRAGLQPDPDRARPGPSGFPLAKFQPGAVAGHGLQPVHPDRRLADASTARRSSPPATARSTSCTTPTPATACSASTSPARRRPASSPSRGSTCCSSRASTPASRSSTSAPTPASR